MVEASLVISVDFEAGRCMSLRLEFGLIVCVAFLISFDLVLLWLQVRPLDLFEA